MIKSKCPIKIREMLIGLIIGIIFFIFGTIFDYDLSKNIYDPINTNMFGVIMSGVCELPTCFALAFAGLTFIFKNPKTSKAINIICPIIGIIAIGLALFFTYDTMQYISTYNNTSQYKTLTIILGIILALIFVGGIILFYFKKLKQINTENIFKISSYFLIMLGTITIVAILFNHLWSRPRPYYIFSFNDSKAYFKNVWELNPFACLINKGKLTALGFTSDALKSFPSLHTAFATTGIFVLPLLTLLSYKDNNKWQIILFYIGLAWALLCAFSRILAGNHFLSDVNAGYLITYIINIIGVYILFHQKKKAIKVE